ncbi:MAG: N-formylglutamate amidohydrolase [Gammaproteobacteria bacterium]|nr:N-formylglutamate amidohydrolase [Gammaproteobacteria bacterium]
MSLLSPNDPAPFTLVRGDQASPFVFTCDHAGNRFPEGLGDFGLPAEAREDHIAWDIGAAAVAAQLSADLGGDLVLQTYSRLLIDCNRPPHVPSSIPAKSEHTVIEANHDLSEADRLARRHSIFDPYHRAIADTIDNRMAHGRRTVLVSVHSFTPVYLGVQRPMHVGLLFNRDPRLGRMLKERLERDPKLVVAENEPYAVGDDTDYTIPVHGEQRGIAHVMIEIRNDLIRNERGQSAWAVRLAKILREADRDLRES